MLFLLIPLIMFGVANGLLYKLNKRGAVVTIFAYAFWGLVSATCIFGVYALFVKNPFANANWEVIGWITLDCVLSVAGLYTWIKGIRYVPVSIGTPFSYINLFGLIIISWLIFNEAISAVAFILICLVFISCMTMGFLQYKSEKDKSSIDIKNYVKGMLWIILWVIISCGYAICNKSVANAGVSGITYLFIYSVLAFPIACIVLFVSRHSVRDALRLTFKDPVLIGIPLTGCTIIFYLPLLLVMHISVLEAILIITTVLTILGGVVLLKERIRWYIYPFIAVVLICSVALCFV